MVKTGVLEYLEDFGNYLDLIYIWGSMAMSILHIINGPMLFSSKLVMIIVIAFSIIRTFKYMRIFKDFSPIVTMLSSVIYDLKQFLLFYVILIGLFSMQLSILGLGVRTWGPIQDQLMADNEGDNFSQECKDDPLQCEWDDDPVEEFSKIGLFTGNFLQTLKISTGDFGAIDSSVFLDKKENFMFWGILLIIITTTCIVFLNFIIAEASASYENVSASLTSFITSEKASLIAEAEGMRPNFLKTAKTFPKYIIVRKIDN